MDLGEVLFLGASGSKRGADDWEAVFRNDNITTVSCGPDGKLTGSFTLTGTNDGDTYDCTNCSLTMTL